MTRRLKFIAMSEVPDNKTVNTRVKAWTSRQLPDNVFYSPHKCSVHLAQRCVSTSFGMKKVGGDVHVVWVTTRNPGLASKLGGAATQSVDEELVVLPGPPPD